MSVRAKFYVVEITRSKHWDRAKGEVQTIKLQPVSGDDSPENKAFYEAMPTGSIQLATVNEEVGRQFQLGQEYYVDFTPAN